ncbi:MAG: protein-disulfide reductase DsbD family protein [Paludibaculum sp.]
MYEGETVFYLRLKLKPEAAKDWAVNVRYQACNDKLCLPPSRR